MELFQNYITINQLAKVCSISRASILRMEHDGILAPAYVNPDNGYRYYDFRSVLHVSRNLSLQEMGITHKELKALYNLPNSYEELLNNLQAKMALMEYHISILKLHLREYAHLSINHFYFPEMYCYTKKMYNVIDPSTVRPYLWDVFEEVVNKGYAIDRRMSPFVLANYKKMQSTAYKATEYNYEICIPIINEKKDGNIKHFDATDTLSTVLYGGSNDIQLAFNKLNTEIKNNNYTTSKHIRIIAVINSFPGEDIPKEYRISRLSIPICNC